MPGWPSSSWNAFPMNRDEMTSSMELASSSWNVLGSSIDGKSSTVYAMLPRDVLICCSMLTFLEPMNVVIWPSTPGVFLWMMHRRAPIRPSFSGSTVCGKLTELRMVPTSRNSMIVSAAIAAELSSASSIGVGKVGDVLAGQLARVPHVLDGLAVDDLAARKVEQVDVGLAHGQGLGVEHVVRAVLDVGHVHSDVVRRFEQVLKLVSLLHAVARQAPCSIHR
eukprot:363061-Chlamydomonas_euryale.AAC.1